MHTEKKVFVAKLWIVIAYLVMWYICYRLRLQVDLLEFENLIINKDFFSAIGAHINVFVIGVCMFIFPYEYLFSLLSDFLFEIIKPLSTGKKQDVKSIDKYICIGILLIFYIALVVIYKNTDLIPSWRCGITCLILSFIAYFISYQIYDMVTPKWMRYFLSNILVVLINTIICFYLNHKFINAAMVHLIMLVSWHTYDSFVNKKIDFSGMAMSFVYSLVTLGISIHITGRFSKWCSYISPYGEGGNQSSFMMQYLRQKPFWCIDFATSNNYLKHPFVGISKLCGAPIMIVHIILFVSMIVAAVIIVRSEIGKDKKRICAFLSIFSWFVVIYVYRLLCDIGMLPEASITFIDIGNYIPAMAIMFRTLWIRRETCYVK